ncbi:MAG: alpha/beta hydrolase [Oceanicaulis sp.]|uniref:alpha/beta hydrolase n=1 Tax=Glycocaulis sp. TaxID=1969725 RepID=UPI0025BD447E|nr:alpha/beta hydrolase [Glycocaulis sp.]MCC5980558.1 alpha/beta hydrolase [Oceanicaulis sp.]MCH8520642.1 alpha/beta hydrolase [Glycocaulis sp.]
MTIEHIPQRKGLRLRGLLGRRMARKAGRESLSPGIDVAHARARMDKAGRQMPMPKGVAVTTVVLGGMGGLSFTPDGARRGTLVYLHGGGYSRGSALSHRALVARMSKAFGLNAVSINYRMAPEHPCPAAIDDAVSAIQAVMAEEKGPVILSGDSAGGGLALSATLRLRDAGERLPDALYLISPWTDLSMSGESVSTKAMRDPMLNPDYLGAGGQLYLGGRPGDDPEASPLFADLKGLPPTLIQVGSDEILLSDSTRLAEKLEAAGVPVDCEIWDGMWHDFQIFSPLIPEADWAIDRARVWVELQLA